MLAEHTRILRRVGDGKSAAASDRFLSDIAVCSCCLGVGVGNGGCSFDVGSQLTSEASRMTDLHLDITSTTLLPLASVLHSQLMMIEKKYAKKIAPWIP